MAEIYDGIKKFYTEIEKLNNLSDIFNPLILQNKEALSKINTTLNRVNIKNLDELSKIFEDAFNEMKSQNLEKYKKYIDLIEESGINKSVASNDITKNYTLAEKDILIDMIREKEEFDRYDCFWDEKFTGMLDAIELRFAILKDSMTPEKYIVYEDGDTSIPLYKAKMALKISPIELTLAIYNKGLAYIKAYQNGVDFGISIFDRVTMETFFVADYGDKKEVIHKINLQQGQDR